MSAHVTIQRTFTTTTTSALLVNVGYMKTLPGLLKIFQVLLGCVAVGIIGHYITWVDHQSVVVSELFFLLVATTCLITTTLLVFSCVFSIATASILPKTLFETLYHIVATILYVAAGITLLVQLNKHNNRYGRSHYYEEKTAAASIGLVNAALYFLSTLYSVKAFRRG
ncbi:UNVERIFIED_CONTAM: hypothetical protein RMT77_003196 [Armadillidium vulgare]